MQPHSTAMEIPKPSASLPLCKVRPGLASGYSAGAASFVGTITYPQPVIGDLHQTPKGWAVEAPSECINGHVFGPYKVIVGHQPCSCEGSHQTWTCRECGDTFYWPPDGPRCNLLHGGGHKRPPL